MWHVVQVSFLARQEEGTKLGAARTRQKCQVLGRKLGTQTLNNQPVDTTMAFVCFRVLFMLYLFNSGNVDYA